MINLIQKYSCCPLPVFLYTLCTEIVVPPSVLESWDLPWPSDEEAKGGVPGPCTLLLFLLTLPRSWASLMKFQGLLKEECNCPRQSYPRPIDSQGNTTYVTESSQDQPQPPTNPTVDAWMSSAHTHKMSWLKHMVWRIVSAYYYIAFKAFKM